MALEGKLVTLRERRPSDAAFLASLRNDLETQAWSKTLPLDYTEEMVLKYDQSREFSFDRFEGRFMIEVKETGEAAGTCSYSQLQPRFSAMIGWAVGKPFWGKGIARDANEVLIRFMFEELGLRVTDVHGEPIDWSQDGDLPSLVIGWPEHHAALIEAIIRGT